MTTALTMADSSAGFSKEHANTQVDDQLIGQGEFRYKVDKAWAKMICTSREKNCFKVFTLDGKFMHRSNKVVSNPGGNAPIYKNNVLQATMQAPGQIFQHCHDVCIDEDKNIYVCQWNANNTSPIKLTRV